MEHIDTCSHCQQPRPIIERWPTIYGRDIAVCVVCANILIEATDEYRAVFWREFIDAVNRERAIKKLSTHGTVGGAA